MIEVSWDCLICFLVIFSLVLKGSSSSNRKRY